MRRAAVAAAFLIAAPVVAAQTTGIETSPLDAPIFEQAMPDSVSRQMVETAPGAVLRALDKVSGEVLELTLANGESTTMGLIEIRLGECRFPQGNPAGDAFAWVEVRTPGRGSSDFAGWMIASSPALNALDHARYDVWVMRCSSV
jgi:hypothetical protein